VNNIILLESSLASLSCPSVKTNRRVKMLGSLAVADEFSNS
jgi:hypothetical protein